jgi:hypothetical protein
MFHKSCKLRHSDGIWEGHKSKLHEQTNQEQLKFEQCLLSFKPQSYVFPFATKAIDIKIQYFCLLFCMGMKHGLLRRLSAFKNNAEEYWIHSFRIGASVQPCQLNDGPSVWEI